MVKNKSMLDCRCFHLTDCKTVPYLSQVATGSCNNNYFINAQLLARSCFSSPSLIPLFPWSCRQAIRSQLFKGWILPSFREIITQWIRLVLSKLIELSTRKWSILSSGSCYPPLNHWSQVNILISTPHWLFHCDRASCGGSTCSCHGHLLPRWLIHFQVPAAELSQCQRVQSSALAVLV